MRVKSAIEPYKKLTILKGDYEISIYDEIDAKCYELFLENARKELSYI